MTRRRRLHAADYDAGQAEADFEDWTLEEQLELRRVLTYWIIAFGTLLFGLENAMA